MSEPRYEEVAGLSTYDRETGVPYRRIGDRNTIRRKYVAGSIKANRQVHYSGYYNTSEEAAARAEADLKFNFHDNHGKGRAEYVRKKPIA